LHYCGCDIAAPLLLLSYHDSKNQNYWQHDAMTARTDGEEASALSKQRQ
jgi:hypothetical protein